MGLRKIFEDMLHIKMAPKPAMPSGLPITSEKDDLAHKQTYDYSNGSLLDVNDIEKFRTLSRYRNDRYTAYENMLEDPITSTALEMYADDATQYNRDNKIIWVESNEPEIAQAGNRLLDVMGINEKAWRHIYGLATYGDIYLRLYRDGDSPDYEDVMSQSGQNTVKTKIQDGSRRLEEYIEYVDNPATIYDLQTKDKTSAYIRINTTEDNVKNSRFNGMALTTVSSNDTIIYDRTSFIHISLSESIDRYPECLCIQNEDESSTIYKIKSGKSILADAYSVTQDLKLLEDSLLLNRLTKSALIRLLQIEVGDMPKPQVEELLHRVKNLLEQKMSLNKNTGEARSYNAPGPMENIVYFPTKEGKGAITVNNLGGDVNVKDIVDLDYFNNKKLAALKIPKQYLNFDSPEGLGNGTSLTKISSRYAHTIMRIQTAYTSGIATLLNLHFMDKGLDYVNKFTVKMVSPATVEDTERDEQLGNRIQQCSDILSMFDEIDPELKQEATVHLMKNSLNLPELADMLQTYLDEHAEDTEENTNEINDTEFGDDDFGSSSFGGSHSTGPSGEADFGSDVAEPSDAPETEPANEPDLDDIDFSDSEFGES